MKIVINSCYGGFGVSNEAAHFIAERKNVRLVEKEGIDGNPEYAYYLPDQPYGEPIPVDGELYERGTLQSFRYIDRTDDDLIAAVWQFGAAAGGEFAELKIVEIPDDVEWQIAEYDGNEWIAEKHRVWS